MHEPGIGLQCLYTMVYYATVPIDAVLRIVDRMYVRPSIL